jgi:hypothetical protein
MGTVQSQSNPIMRSEPSLRPNRWASFPLYGWILSRWVPAGFGLVLPMWINGWAVQLPVAGRIVQLQSHHTFQYDDPVTT